MTEFSLSMRHTLQIGFSIQFLKLVKVFYNLDPRRVQEAIQTILDSISIGKYQLIVRSINGQEQTL